MNKTETLMIRLNEELKNQIITASKKLNISMTTFAIIAMIEKLNRIQER